jgi:hypothetical protein
VASNDRRAGVPDQARETAAPKDARQTINILQALQSSDASHANDGKNEEPRCRPELGAKQSTPVPEVGRCGYCIPEMGPRTMGPRCRLTSDE